MRLEKLLGTLTDYKVCPAINDFEVKGIASDSKQVTDGFIFVAVKGSLADGHNFIDEAINKGAKAIVADSQVSAAGGSASGGTNIIMVKDARKALAQLAAEFYGRPCEQLKVIGITGTNGKTTISYLIEAILREAHREPAVIGTINYRFRDKIIPATNTTPGSLQLQAMFKEMLSQGVGYAVMEVSSHALDQARTEGINFHSAIFTNLTQDHLDYHKDLENYFQAKAKLFEYLQPDNYAVINNDDDYGRRLIKLTKARVITYGIKYNVDVLARDIRFDFSHTEFILKAGLREANFKTQLIGRHNVYNILASVAFTINEGIELDLIRSAIEKFSLVPGRLERIPADKDFYIFVDYAHTEDALRNVINTLREISNKKIIVVFGCGGERDRTKRPKMGALVTEMADYCVITSDNPRSEDPLGIINEIKSGIKKDNYYLIPDRKEAIKKSLSLARAGDIVVVAGKGHENYQVVKGEKFHFDDREVIKECLK